MLLPPPPFDSSSPGFVMKGMHTVELTFYIPTGTLKAQLKKCPALLIEALNQSQEKQELLYHELHSLTRVPIGKRVLEKKKKKKKVDIRHHWSTNFKRHFKPKLTSQKSILKNQTWIPMKYQSLDVY